MAYVPSDDEEDQAPPVVQPVKYFDFFFVNGTFFAKPTNRHGYPWAQLRSQGFFSTTKTFE